MKIKSITIKNFKSIDNLTYTSNNKIIALIGPNGRGKTAFKEAFYAGITGEFPEGCIQIGKDECSVEMTTEDGFNFERIQYRTKPNKVLVNGKISTVKALNELLIGKFGLSKDVLKVVTSTDVLQNMKSAEFGQFILTYLPKKFCANDILEMVKEDVSEDEKKLLTEYLSRLPEEFGVKELGTLYDVFAEKRKVGKKFIIALEEKTKETDITPPTRAMEIIENELNETLKAEGEQKGLKTALNLYNISLANRKKAIEILQNLKVKIEENKSVKPDETVSKKIKEEKDASNKTIISAKTTINTANANIKMYKNTLNNLNKPVCPISEKLICTTDKSAIKEELENLVSLNENAIAEQNKIITVCNEKLVSLENQEKEYRNNEMKYQEKVLLVSRFKSQKASLPVVAEKPVIKEFKDYEPTIRSLTKERDNAVAYGRLLKDKKDLDMAYLKLKACETLCELFKPKGKVVSKVMEIYISVFENMANATAEKLRHGFAIKFNATNGISYTVRTGEDKPYRSFDSLSSGEQLLTLFILTDMLSQFTGSKLLLLDDLDKLDADAFSELINIITNEEVKDAYDHIILCAVEHDDIVDALDRIKVDKIY